MGSDFNKTWSQQCSLAIFSNKIDTQLPLTGEVVEIIEGQQPSDNTPP